MPTYPTPAGKRMAIDADGTQLFSITPANVVAQLSAANLTTINDEADTSITTETKLALYFPEIRTISAIFVANDQAFVLSTIDISLDTTNFIDGTFTTVAISGTTAAAVNPAYRGSLITIGRDAKALRLTTRTIWKAWHVYGVRQAGEYLEFTNSLGATLSDDALDYGDTAIAGSEDRTVYVTNRSASATADGVVVTSEILTDSAAPSVPTHFVFSDDNLVWTATLNLGTLAPGGTSGPIMVRRITPSNAVLGLWNPRLRADPTTWSV